MRTASFSLFTILCLLLAVAPSTASTLYTNGPPNGTTDAWAINFGFSVSDSFSLCRWGCPYPVSIEGLNFVYWDASSSDVLTTVDMSMGSTPFGADYFSGTLTGVTNTFLGTNQYGYVLFQADYSFYLWDYYWNDGYLTLQNACSTSGCSVENPIYWDENSGPSMAYQTSTGSIPSEAFTLTGSVCWWCYSTPEPSSILLFGSGILGLVGILRRKLGR
jgi:hypothetical protein